MENEAVVTDVPEKGERGFIARTWQKVIDSVSRALTVRDIFYLAVGFSIATGVWYTVWRLVMNACVLMGKFIYNGKVYDLIEVIAKNP